MVMLSVKEEFDPVFGTHDFFGRFISVARAGDLTEHRD
jgi:hypothetical protein